MESWTPYTSSEAPQYVSGPVESNPAHRVSFQPDPVPLGGASPSPTLRPPGDGATPQGASVSGQAFAASQLDARQFDCLDAIVMHESRWRVDATNRTSGAYGIPQALPAWKMASAGADWRTNPVTQVRWMLGYIHGRYGSPCAAWAFWRGHGWY